MEDYLVDSLTDSLSRLPIDLFIQQITYLPYDEVVSICQANKKLHDYCTKYDTHWKSLIRQAFSNLPDYAAILKEIHQRLGGEVYNYLVYTQFMNYLDPAILLLIYNKQNDKVNFDRVFQQADEISKLIFYYRIAKFDNFLSGSNMDKIAALWLIGLNKLIEFGKTWEGPDEKAYASKFIRASFKTASQQDLNDLAISLTEVGNLQGLKRMLQLGADINAISDLSEPASYGYLDVIKYVWKLRGSDTEERGDTVLWSAPDQPAATRYIVELGISQNNLNTLLRLYENNPEMIEYLRSKGAKN